jgi:aminoglycoside phosphotransferase (APT) family kinase protein
MEWKLGPTSSASPAADRLASAEGNLKAIVDASVMATKPKFTDIEPNRLAAFIARQPDVSGEVTLSSVRGGGASAGASSGIVVFDADIAGERRGYVLRYAPMNHAGRIFAEYDVAGQFETQRRLGQSGFPAPHARWLDATGEHLGLPGFIMDKVDGEVADGSPFTGGLIAEADHTERLRLIGEILRALRGVHQVDWRALGLQDCSRDGGGRTPLERYLNSFWKTAEWAPPPARERLEAVRLKLFADQPTYHEDDHTLIHGDPGLGNYMFRDGKVVSVLDWELSGILHPTYDVAMQCSLHNYFRGAAPPEVARTIPSNAEWVALYEQVSGAKVRDFDFFQRAVALPSLIVNLSMHRNIPAQMKAAHLAMMEATWSVAEAQ